MMPIYFNLQSHLWIAYLFFINGFLIHSFCRCYSDRYAAMTQPLEASLLATFFISLGLNSLLLLLLDLTAQNFSVMQVLLPIISIGLLLLLWLKAGWRRLKISVRIETSSIRLILYAFVFIVLFYNGGLIEQISDAWWHMSLANKIGLENTFTPALGHLTGTPTRYYPPLWHANLALARTMSDISIPVFWNSMTAWVGALKVMGFYLLAYSLSGKRSIATLSALLFCVLPGLGDSYLRVSAWPSHIAYTAMFAQFYVAFWIIDHYQGQTKNTLCSIFSNLLKQKHAVLAFVVISILMLFVHQLELLWFYCGLTAYLAALIIYRLVRKHKIVLADSENSLLLFLTGSVLLLGFGASVFGLYQDWHSLDGNLDRLIVGLFFPTLFFLLLLALVYIQKQGAGISKKIVWVFLTLITLLVLASIDVHHFLALIFPELAYPIIGSREGPHIVVGVLGGDLKLPGWHLQLRPALLYSGLISIPISIVLAILKPSRLTLFLSANAIVALLFCVSPYFYHWLASILNYHSPWRIATLLFHPIIIAATIHLTWNKFKAGVKK